MNFEQEQIKLFFEKFGEKGNLTNGERYQFKLGITPQHIFEFLLFSMKGARGEGYAKGYDEGLNANWGGDREIQLNNAREDALKEERQFILNILDGIDEADRQMQNKGGGTKAIRFALESRIVS